MKTKEPTYTTRDGKKVWVFTNYVSYNPYLEKIMSLDAAEYLAAKKKDTVNKAMLELGEFLQEHEGQAFEIRTSINTTKDDAFGNRVRYAVTVTIVEL